jgi:2-polyprenyl-3-methyl-5-hydroxy-6-metoxy-1,4-benzoquinol methylase
MNPPHDPTDTGQDFRSKYTEERGVARKLLDGFFRSVNDCVADTTAQSAIEVGCGEGFSTQRLRKMLSPSASFRASDIETRLVQAARTNNPGMTIEQESIYQLPHATGAFDLVFVLEVLEHLEDPAKGLAEICRISNRWVIASVPREPIWRMLNFARLKYVTALGNTPGHLNHWSSVGFAKFIGRQTAVKRLEQPLPWTVVLAEVRR